MKSMFTGIILLTFMNVFATTLSCSEVGNLLEATNWYFTDRSEVVTINYWQGRAAQSFQQELISLDIEVEKKRAIRITDENDIILEAQYDFISRKYVGVFQVNVEQQEAADAGVPDSLEKTVYCHQVN